MKLKFLFRRRLVFAGGIALVALLAVCRSGVRDGASVSPVTLAVKPAKYRQEMARAVVVDAAELAVRFGTASDPDMRAKMGDELVASGDEAALRAFMDALLAETDPEMKKALAGCLDRIEGGVGMELTVSLLGATEDAEIVAAAIRTIARAADGDTIDFLVTLREEAPGTPSQQEHVLRAVAAIRNPEATAGLAVLLTPGHDAGLAHAAIGALGGIGTASAYGALLEAFDEVPRTSFALRAEMVEAVRCCKNPAARDFLESLADDELAQPLFGIAAREALERLPMGGIEASEALPVATWLPAKRR